MFIIGLILAVVIAVVFTPTPQMPQAQMPNLDNFVSPTADESRVVQEVFGTTLIRGSNCFFFDNLRNEIIYTG